MITLRTKNSLKEEKFSTVFCTLRAYLLMVLVSVVFSLHSSGFQKMPQTHRTPLIEKLKSVLLAVASPILSLNENKGVGD